MEGLYSGLGGGAGMTAQQLEAKIKLLVEAPAAVEDALASLLDHHDTTLQVRSTQYSCKTTATTTDIEMGQAVLPNDTTKVSA